MTHAGRMDPAGNLMTFGTEAHNCTTMSIYHEYREVMYQYHRFGMDIDLKRRLKIIVYEMYTRFSHDSVNSQCSCNFFRRRKIDTFCVTCS